MAAETRVSFIQLHQVQDIKGKTICIGLDPDLDKIPNHLLERHGFFEEDAVEEFITGIVDTTIDDAWGYKPNFAFFEAKKWEKVLKSIIEHIHDKNPNVPVIGDGKRADITNTNRFYRQSTFERYGIDALTTNPWFGGDTFPTLGQPGKGLFILCKTSNPGSGELQDMTVDITQSQIDGLLSEDEVNELLELFDEERDPKVYELVAYLTSRRWNNDKNMGLVVGATHPEAFIPVRRMVGEMPILVPGIGTQQGDLEKTLRFGLDKNGQNIIINSGSKILYASNGEDFADAARAEFLKLHNEIQRLKGAA